MAAIGTRTGGLVLALCTAVLSGCASGGPAEPASVPSTTPAGATRLTVRWDDGAGSSGTWRLRCDPPGGDHPHARAACAALAAGGSWLAPVPAGQVCAQVYGGPQTATVHGTWRGRAVSASLSRTDGCQIRRWDALRGLLPDPARA